MRLVDLHTHSNFSDGTLSPAQVVHAAAAKKVELLALADHDTVDGCAKARETAAQLKLPFVEAAEISTAEDDHLHIIGYGRRLPGSGIADFLAQLRAKRMERIKNIVGALKKEGLDLSEEDVGHEAASVQGRAHVADALVAKGYASNRPEAFRKFLVPGRPGYQPPVGAPINEAIAAIRACGGVAVLAHPGAVQGKWNFPEWVQSGLGGVEAYYPTHSVETTREMLAIAARYRLLVTAGSDFHGPKSGISKTLGIKVSDEEFEAMKVGLLN